MKVLNLMVLFCLVKTNEARYQKAQASTDEALGEALGKLYVEQYFDENQKSV